MMSDIQPTPESEKPMDYRYMKSDSKSDGWSDSQKEAIREAITPIIDKRLVDLVKAIRRDDPKGLDVLAPGDIKDILVSTLVLEILEAITKGDEQ